MTHQEPSEGLCDQDRRGLWPAEVVPVALSAGVSLAVQLAGYWLARVAGATEALALVACIAVSCCWLAVAGPVIAAGAPRRWSVALRTGAAVDALGVGLAILWLSGLGARGDMIGFGDVAKVYLIWAAAAVAIMAVCAVAPAGLWRLAVAAALAVVLLGALASAFWSSGLLAAGDWQHKLNVAGWLVRINPFFVISQMLAGQTGFAWPTAPLMYNIGRLGDYVSPPPVAWYEPAVIYLSLAVAAIAIRLICDGVVLVLRRSGMIAPKPR